MVQQSGWGYTGGVKITKLALQKVFFFFDQSSSEGAASAGHCHQGAETAFKAGLAPLHRATLRLSDNLMLAGEGSSGAPSGGALGMGKPWILTGKFGFEEMRLWLQKFSSVCSSSAAGSGTPCCPQPGCSQLAARQKQSSGERTRRYIPLTELVGNLFPSGNLEVQMLLSLNPSPVSF